MSVCECGCGEPIPAFTAQGLPRRFVWGHNPRQRDRWREEDRGYETPCWIWQLFTTRRGYGRVRSSEGNRFAYRVMWEERNGPVPEGLQLDHLCRVRACVNPDHLEPVPCRINIRRGANTKLTFEKAEAIRRDDRRYREIAAEHGVSISTVCDIRKGRKWVAA